MLSISIELMVSFLWLVLISVYVTDGSVVPLSRNSKESSKFRPIAPKPVPSEPNSGIRSDANVPGKQSFLKNQDAVLCYCDVESNASILL